MFEVIVDMIRTSSPELADYPQSELDLVTCGSKVSFTQTETDLRNLRKGFDKVKGQAPTITKTGDDDKFQERITAFLEESEKQLVTLEENFAKAQAAYEKVVQQYQEDPKKMGPEDFFVTWVTFVSKVRECNEKAAKAKEEIEKQKKREEAAAKKAAGGPAARGGGMMAGALAAEAAARGAARGTRGATRGARGGSTAGGDDDDDEPGKTGATRGVRGATRGGVRGRGGGVASKQVADSLFDNLTAGNVFKK